ncbi:MAG: hypothetical protein ACFB9M_12925 [Myxococcota bacterium]
MNRPVSRRRAGTRHPAWDQTFLSGAVAPALLFWVGLLGGSCASQPLWQTAPHDRVFQQAGPPTLHPPYTVVPESDTVFMVQNSGVRPIARLVSPGAYVDRLGGKESALDVNAFGQVPDSSWFTNRIGRRPMSVAEVARGPDDIEGPAPGLLEVLGGKLEGVSPGFVVQDAAGHRFLVKLDHPAHPELGSGAEIIATKVLHAAGYHVPQNFVVTFDLDDLRLSPDATTVGRYGTEIPLTEEVLQQILSNANPFPDGTIRALFSRLIEGQVIGSFAYEGTCSKDPNDKIPHERRRSLRGLRIFFAWINNTDARASNTLDVFIPSPDDPSLGHVRHYLLDFGDALGASGTESKYLSEGYEGFVDLEFMAYGLFSLGIYYRYWLPVQRSPFRSVGTFEAQYFEPKLWRAVVPNPAFEEATIEDEYWAASILARFSPSLVEAIVDSAEYSNPSARAWILRVLLERQYKLLAATFRRVLPLENLRVDGYHVQMDDLAVDLGLAPEDSAYIVSIADLGQREQQLEVDSPSFDLRELMPPPAPGAFVTVRLARKEPDGRQSPDLQLHLRMLDEGVLPVGLKRNHR